MAPGRAEQPARTVVGREGEAARSPLMRQSFSTYAPETARELVTVDRRLQRDSSRNATIPSTSVVHDMLALPLTKSDTNQPVPARAVWQCDRVHGLRVICSASAISVPLRHDLVRKFRKPVHARFGVCRAHEVTVDHITKNSRKRELVDCYIGSKCDAVGQLVEIDWTGECGVRIHDAGPGSGTLQAKVPGPGAGKRDATTTLPPARDRTCLRAGRCRPRRNSHRIAPRSGGCRRRSDFPGGAGFRPGCSRTRCG